MNFVNLVNFVNFVNPIKQHSLLPVLSLLFSEDKPTPVSFVYIAKFSLSLTHSLPNPPSLPPLQHTSSYSFLCHSFFHNSFSTKHFLHSLLTNNSNSPSVNQALPTPTAATPYSYQPSSSNISTGTTTITTHSTHLVNLPNEFTPPHPLPHHQSKQTPL